MSIKKIETSKLTKITNWYAVQIENLTKNAFLILLIGIYIKGLVLYFSGDKLWDWLSPSFFEWILITLTTFLIYTFFLFIIKVYDNTLALEDKMKVSDEHTNTISKTINREIVSINSNNIAYDSKIIKHLFKSHEDPANYLVKDLKVGNSYPIGDSIVSDAFSLASEAEFAKACCMVSDEKYIKYYSNKEYSEVTDLLYYFKKQKEYTERNLNINRIFSFPFTEESSKIISFSKKEDSLALLLYMIFNYTSNVNTYLHIFNNLTCETEGTEAVFCSRIDYVSLMWYNSKFHYNAFITPQGDDLNLVVVNDNDILLHKFLEEDYTVRAEAKPDTDVNRQHYCIKFKPKTYKKILIHLGLSDMEDVYTQLEGIINSLPEKQFGDNDRPDFTRKKMISRIDLFFHQTI